MVQDPSDFTKQGTDVLGALRDLNVQQFLHSERETLLIGHHRNVVQTVKVWQRLQICPVLDELLCASVQQSNVRIGAHNLLAIEFQNQSQHTVGGGMLGPKVDSVMPDLPLVGVVLLVLLHALVLGILGVGGPAEVLLGRNQARSLAFVDFCISARQCRRQAARNGPLWEGCSELWAGGVQAQPLRRVAG
tara:strand:+ start:986 stop:1555 length:570 start_codon:yes stop_codon:yes gene_type:complete